MSKRFSTLNWIFLLLLSASLVVTTGCGKDKKGAGTAKSPTTVPYMHPDFRVAIVIQPQQILKSKLVTSVTDKLPMDPLAEMTKEFREETGLEVISATLFAIYSEPRFVFTNAFGGEHQPIHFAFRVDEWKGSLVTETDESVDARFWAANQMPDRYQEALSDLAAFAGTVILK